MPAREAGVLKGRARVLDSTALYDAVATQDTVTQLRAAIRKVLATVAPALAAKIRSALRRTTTAPPSASRRVTGTTAPPGRPFYAVVRDAHAALAVLDGHVLEGAAAEAAALLVR